MIISASRRTDIPAFYGDWFLKRFEDGIFYIKNPFNPKQIKIINIYSSNVDCIVFWTKNPKPFIKKLNQIKYPYYFLYTITNYGKSLEPFVPEIKESLTTFKELSSIIGPERIIWRYDPIIFTNKFNEDWHLKNFEFLCKSFQKLTNNCIIFFIYLYKKCNKNLKSIEIYFKSEKELKTLIKNLEIIGINYNIEVSWCCIDKNLLNENSVNSSCINKYLIEKLINKKLLNLKDKNQRDLCNCYPSIDIGTYNTCIHGCKYCYANINYELAFKNFSKHNPDNLFII